MYSINRLCGSGFQSVVNGCQIIANGESDVVLAVGTENMSMAPFCMFGSRFGVPLGTVPKLTDSLWNGLTDTYCKLPMAITAENLAEKYDISRADCDLYALQSQQRWAKANSEGAFASEICPIEVKAKKNKKAVFEVDEHPKADLNVDSFAKLKPVFKEHGTVTAGTASGGFSKVKT